MIVRCVSLIALGLLAGGNIGGCARTPSPAPSVASPTPYFALRLAFNDSVAGRQRASYGDGVVFLGPEVLLSDDDVLTMSAGLQRDNRLLLNLRYRPEAGKRLQAATTGRTGEQIAVVVENRVWNVTPIAGPVGAGDHLVVSIGAERTDAERITQQVRARWPTR